MVDHLRHSVPRHTNRFAGLETYQPSPSGDESSDMDPSELMQADQDTSIQPALLDNRQDEFREIGGEWSRSESEKTSEDKHGRARSQATSQTNAHSALNEHQAQGPGMVGPSLGGTSEDGDMPSLTNADDMHATSNPTTQSDADQYPPPPDPTGLSQGLSRLALAENAPAARETLQKETDTEELRGADVSDSGEASGVTFTSRYTPEYLRSLYPPNTVTHSVDYTTHYRPAIVQEVVRPSIHEIVEVHRTRSIHLHEHRQAVQPILDPDRDSGHLWEP